VMHIVGLGKACEVARRDLDRNTVHMRDLRDRLHDKIMSAIDQVRLNGPVERRLPNTLNLSFYGIEANRLLEEIGLDVAASAGAACHSNAVADTVEISHVLQAMAVPEAWARGTVRFSLGKMTTEPEIDRAVAVVAAAAKKLRSE